MSKDSSVRIATLYGLDGPVSIPGRGQNFLLSTASLPTLRASEIPGRFRLGLSDWGVKLITHLHLVPRSRMVELVLN
jgi:hypothetical protein